MEAQFHNFRIQKKRFLQLAAKSFAQQDYQKIVKAFAFAQQEHQGQRRDEGNAYIIHPLRVAITLLEEVETWDSDVVVAALLHDVVEDCGVRVVTIKKHFGKRVAQFVEALTRRRLSRESEIQKEAHKKRKLDELLHRPLEVRLIKCADILDNLRCAADVPWWQWTPLARRKFPRWHREFHYAAEFAKAVHPLLFRAIQRELRVFDLKRFVRGVVGFRR